MNTEKTDQRKFRLIVIGTAVAAAVASVLVTALLMNIFERKAEALRPDVRLVEVDEDTTDPAVWGKNWPKEYDSYLRTANIRLSQGSRSIFASGRKNRTGSLAQTNVCGLRVFHRLPGQTGTCVHAARSGRNQAPDQAAVRVVYSLPRFGDADVPQARRRRRGQGF